MKRVFQKDNRPGILFDGVCNFCNFNVNLVLRWDKKGNFRFAPIQSKVGSALMIDGNRDPKDMSSMLLVERGPRIYDKSTAVIKILKGMDSRILRTLGFFVQLIPWFLRDAAYSWVGENRYWIMGI